jgi:hypothetical protein
VASASAHPSSKPARDDVLIDISIAGSIAGSIAVPIDARTIDARIRHLRHAARVFNKQFSANLCQFEQ